MPLKKSPSTPSTGSSPQNPPAHDFVKARTQGLQIVGALLPTQLTAIQRIDSPEGYLQMDAKLASIRNARAQWELALSPITEPLQRAITKAKETLAEVKRAAEGANRLDEEFSLQLDKLEAHVKGLMRDYKLEEQRQLQAAEEERRQEQERLRKEQIKLQAQAAAAKTPQMKARLEQARAEAGAKAAAVAEQQEVATPIRGGASTARKIQKPVITDVIAFLQAVRDYKPKGGVYEFGHPPLMVGEKALVEIVNARLMEVWRDMPGIVESWPGVTIMDDIQIAGR